MVINYRKLFLRIEINFLSLTYIRKINKIKNNFNSIYIFYIVQYISGCLWIHQRI